MKLWLTVNMPKAAKQPKVRKADLLTGALASPLNGHCWKPFGKGILCTKCQHSLKLHHALATIESGLTLACTGLQGIGNVEEAKVHFTHTLTCITPGKKQCVLCNGVKLGRGKVSQILAKPCRPRKV